MYRSVSNDFSIMTCYISMCHHETILFLFAHNICTLEFYFFIWLFTKALKAGLHETISGLTAGAKVCVLTLAQNAAGKSAFSPIVSKFVS